MFLGEDTAHFDARPHSLFAAPIDYDAAVQLDNAGRIALSGEVDMRDMTREGGKLIAQPDGAVGAEHRELPAPLVAEGERLPAARVLPFPHEDGPHRHAVR